jgi:hypothetical protein
VKLRGCNAIEEEEEEEKEIIPKNVNQLSYVHTIWCLVCVDKYIDSVKHIKNGGIVR